MAKDDFQICASSCWFLKLSLVWPLKDELKPSKWFYFRLGIFMMVSVLPMWLSVLMHLLESLKEEVDISWDLSILATISGLSFVMILYTANQPDLAMLFTDMSDFEKFGKPPFFDKVNKKLDFFAKFCGAFAFVGTMFYNALVIIEIPKCEKFNKINEICGVMTPTWLPFDVSGWQPLVILYVFLTCSTIDRVSLFMSCQILEVACNIKLRIDHLNSMILTCFDGNVRTHRKRLNHCIRYHIAIINFSERLDRCFTGTMFVYLTAGVVICGFIENQIVKQYSFGPMLHLLGGIITFFTSCLGGQLLMDSSESVANAAFYSKWYMTDVKLRKDLILVIMRSQKPLFVSTGAFNVLSFAVFVKMMKMSYSILTLLE